MEAFSFDITLPTSWASLSDTQLRYVFALLLEKRTAIDIQTRCSFHCGGLRVMAHTDLAQFVVRKKRGKFRHTDVLLTARQLQPVVDTLRWIEAPPPEPVRIERIGRHRALPADFMEVPFEKYLYCDNLYQGYLQTKSEGILTELAQVLYDSEHLRPNTAQKIGVFYWFAYLKSFFARKFHYFLQPVSTESANWSAMRGSL